MAGRFGGTLRYLLAATQWSFLAGAALLVALADGVLELRFDSDLNRVLRVRHMRGMSVSSRWIPFEISPARDEPSAQVLEWR